MPYDRLYDLEEVNDDLERTDVAVVIGANEVTNPTARDVSDSPIYRMTILNVDKARNGIFINRISSPWHAARALGLSLHKLTPRNGSVGR